jgi:riboflavin biosynthesis pyrimidine reductase
VRLLMGGPPADAAPAEGVLVDDLCGEELQAVYEPPRLPWLRVNMVSTVDGAATGADGRTAAINNPADHRLFRLLRRMSDVIIVGAGTARAEGYRPTDRPLVVVSGRGDAPPRLREAEPGSVLLATCSSAPGLPDARKLLGDEGVLVVGDEAVDLAGLRRCLVDRGLRHQLCEGGPHLLRDLLAAGAVDEVDMTVVPRVVAGPQGRITAGGHLDVPLLLAALLEEDGTLFGRWLVG